MDLFEIERGRKPTKWQLFIYRCVNIYPLRLISLLVFLFFLAFVCGVLYIILHFVVKYW